MSGRTVQAAVAFAGLVAMLAVLAALLAGNGPVPGWIVRFFALWCVGVPYWWYAEYRWVIGKAPAGEREALLHQQRLSRNVWLGFALAAGTLIVARGLEPG